MKSGRQLKKHDVGPQARHLKKEKKNTYIWQEESEVEWLCLFEMKNSFFLRTVSVFTAISVRANTSDVHVKPDSCFL